jgi:hypothetical protein
MSNERRLTWAHRAGAAAVAAAGLIVAAPALAVPAGALFAQLAPVQVQVGQAFAQADGTGDAIGDPWWDEAEAKPAAAEPDPEAVAEDAEAEEPADAQAMLQAQLRAQVEMLAENVRQQALAILRRELSLVRQTCPSLEKQQRALVLAAGRGAIDRAVAEQTQAAGGGRRRAAKRTDLEAAIRAALTAAVQANAADPEPAAYAAEQQRRVERRKAAVVAALVAEVDREAYLEAAEREALAKVLTESYRERWRPAVAALQQNGLAVPDESILPGLERCVEKALGKDRKARWVAARDEARTLAGVAGGQGGAAAFDNGWVQAPDKVIVPRPQAVRRVIRRQVQVGGGGVQVQVEVQAGAVEAEEAAANENENAPKEDEK